MKTSTVAIEKISPHQNSDGVSNHIWVLRISLKDGDSLLFIIFYIVYGYTQWNLFF